MKYGDEQAKGEMQRQATEQAQKRAQSHEQGQRVETHQQPGKTPENEPTDDLRAVISKAYQQKDVNELAVALATAQAERERQRVVQEQKAEEIRQQAQEAAKVAEQQKIAQQQKIEQTPENAPRISRGLGR
jgi:alpha-L-arabinofuranosidase